MSAGDLRLILLLAAVAVVLTTSTTFAQGNVGCLFSPSVCAEDGEWCFDDYAFGRCQPAGVDESSLYRFDLRREALHMLQKEMDRLFSLGYRWSHLYTQCVLQVMLISIQEEDEYDGSVCLPLVDQDLNSALKALEGEEEKILAPNLVAHVKFTPSAEDPQSDFADEVYYAPLIEVVPPEEVEGIPENVIRAEGDEYVNQDSPLRKLLLNKSDRPKKRQQLGEEPRKVAGVFPIDRFLANAPEVQSPHFNQQYNTPENFRLGIEAKDVAQALASEAVKSFSRTYNTPDTFRLGVETRDLNPADNDQQEEDSNERFLEQVFSSPVGRQLIYDIYRGDNRESRLDDLVLDDDTEDIEEPRTNIFRGAEDRLTHDLEILAGDDVRAKPDGRVFTEGGVVRLADDGGDEAITEADELVRDYGGNWGGFKRRERLDVKKPGPNFPVNNFAFKTKSDSETKIKSLKQTSPEETAKAPINRHQPKAHKAENLVEVRKKGVGSPISSPSLRQKPANTVTDDASDDPVAYIKFKDDVGKWADAVAILVKAAKLLDLDPNAIVHAREMGNEISFKVDRSKANISASEVAKRIEGIKDKLKSSLGVEVTGSGNKEKGKQGPIAVNLTGDDEYQLWLLSFLLCGVIAATVIAGAAFFFIRKHNHTKDKLTGLKQPDSEASKDYQELCRARMATKTQDKPESAVAKMSGKDGEPKSPSSRSSTSSWSEEPAFTNMDISTGHMVLSYMEDHLKNKDRLEQEWIALCAYEAEPCAVTVAVSESNLPKNRYPDITPYDHSRVILNQLLNIHGLDYINASTITDHDPRNPAYIATQGPMENTTADLWQMLWEQGSVVMVMLTRLSENGATMCHRYWPEEGSKVYHIYEVHLVSEHIWCDDYLVRSFYLKNLKTGETRTVTQFHFLSWPETGVPLSTKALLEFRRKVNKSYRGRSCPIVVHCSDGVGRTGTYCLIDMVLNRMAKGAKEIDIAATLEHIRDQRPMMVKTKQQFEFVLMAVAEEVHAILKALPATHSPPPVNKEKE